MAPFAMLFQRRLVSSQRGAITVEGALAIPIYLMLTLVGADFVRVAYAAVAIQFIAAKAIRSEAVIWRDALNQPITGVPKGRQLADEIVASGLGYGLNLTRDTQIGVCPGFVGNCCPAFPAACPSPNAGHPGDLLTITVKHQVTLTTAGLLGMNKNFIVTGQVIGRNESSFPR